MCGVAKRAEDGIFRPLVVSQVLLFPLDLSPTGSPVGLLCSLNLSLLISEVPSRDALAPASLSFSDA